MKYILTTLLSLLALVSVANASKIIYLNENLTDDTTDDTQALKTTINNAGAGDIIVIPAGQLTLNGTVELKNSNGKPVLIQGQHSNLTTVLFKKGGFVFPPGVRGASVNQIACLTMVTNIKNASTAIHSKGKIEIKDVIIKGANNNSAWKKSVVAFNSGAKIDDCIFIGLKSYTKYHIENYGDSGGGSGVKMSNTKLSGAQTAVYIYNTNAEGHTFNAMIVDNVNTIGLRRTGEPTFNWDFSWLRASNLGLQIDGSRDTRVRCNVINISGNSTANAAFTYSHRTQQNSLVRANIIRANTVMKILDKRPVTGDPSSGINDVGIIANYIIDSQNTFDLRHGGFALFFAGNVFNNNGGAFMTSNPGERFFQSELE